jgi:hypothetical protein
VKAAIEAMADLSYSVAQVATGTDAEAMDACFSGD